MNQSDALANIYARSLFDLAEAAGGADKIAEVADELEQICEIARSDRMFREFLVSPIIDRSRRRDSLGRMLNDRVTDLTLRFMLVLNHKGRLGSLESINTAFDHIVQQSLGRIEVDLFTPGPLGDEQRDVIGRQIKDAIGKTPVLHAYTDPDMLGGLKLRIGDQLIDGSVATKLKRLKHNLASSGSARVRERLDQILDQEGAS